MILSMLFIVGALVAASTDIFQKEVDFFSSLPLNSFPSTNRLSNFPKDKVLEFAADTRIMVHPRVLVLIDDFLNIKRKLGSAVEKQVYAGMSKEDFVRRLIEKRPLSFYCPGDVTLSRPGTVPHISGSVHSTWIKVGSSSEGNLRLADYLSYDEMQISALIGTSTPTFFLNDCSRHNNAIPATGSYQKTGIHMGLVGARFEVNQLMEHEYIIETPSTVSWSEDQKAKRLLWSKFLGVDIDNHLPEDLINTTKGNFNRKIYKERIRITVESMLFESDKRGEEQGIPVNLMVSGLGLGVCAHQEEDFMAVVQESLEKFELPHIKRIEMLWFYKGAFDSTFKPKNTSLQIVFSKANPTAVERPDMLTIVVYAWDGNSFPGNEYWMGSLGASGDPAAACCSLIPSLQNPMINHHLLQNISIVGSDVDEEGVVASGSKKTTTTEGGGESKDEPKDGSKDEPKNGPKDGPEDEPKNEPKDGPEDEPKNGPKDGPKDEPKNGSNDEPKDGPKDGPKDEPKNGSKTGDSSKVIRSNGLQVVSQALALLFSTLLSFI